MVGLSRVVSAGRGNHAASLERASNQGGKAASPWSWRSIGVDRGQHDSRLSRRDTRSSRSSPSYCTCAAAPNSSDSIGSATRGGVRKSLINLFKGIGKERNRGELRGMYRTVEVIKEFGEDYRSLSNESLQAKTTEFKQRIGAGETLDSILPEAFALVREASSRVLGMRHFDVQLLGGMVLHNGDIAEMQTGEGKTLVSTLPAYLNALEGKGVHIVTVNDYLAKRDSEWMGQLHQFLGLTVDVVQSSSTPSQRKQAYSADITYVTNQELGFDYLRDNMEFEEENVVLQRDLNFAIIDEVDSILIDEGRNPLLISMLAEEEDQDDFYTKASHIAGELREDLHFTSNLKERTVELTEEGMLEVEYLLGVENMWEGGSSWAKYIVDAIKARQHYIRDVNYIVKDDQVQIIDEFTGRVKPLSRWSGGIHQAVEAKENLKVQSENETAASVTYQCFFKMYNKRAGMTGTAATESEEFWETYGLRVVPIPTNRDCIREDSRSLIYFTQEEKWEGVISEIAEIHSTGQPVLVGTTSVDHSELISRLLSRVGIEHSLLNAKPTNAAQEGKIISQAGRLGAVTISTNMAGRGTDILLGGNPTELVKSVLLENLGPALMKQDDPDAFSGLSEILNMDFPPEYMGLVARAKSSALLECTIPMTAYEVDQLVRGLCSFARQMLEGGGNNILADSQFETYLESKDYAALESFLGSKDFSIGEELPNSAFPPIKKFANAAIFLLEYCNSICRREGDLVRSLGGLHVVGTQLHDSRRVDNQLRGRAGRQGDPGSTIFILSLEDDLLKVYGQDHVGKLMRSILDDNTELSISSGLVDSQLLSLQREVEDWFTGARKQVYKYDQFLDIQRKQIYRLRRHILTSSEHELMHLIFTYIRADVGEIVQKHAARHPKHWDLSEVCNEVEDLVNEDLFPDSFAKDLEKNLAEGSWVLAKEHNYPTSSSYLFAYKAAGQNSGFAIDQISEKRKASEERWSPELSFVVNEITEYVLSEYFCKLRACAALRRGMSTIMSEQRSRMLRLIDERWKKHLKHMETLRNSVSLRVFGQLDPLEEYKVDSARALMVLINSIQREIVREIFQDLNDQM